MAATKTKVLITFSPLKTSLLLKPHQCSCVRFLGNNFKFINTSIESPKSRYRWRILAGFVGGTGIFAAILLRQKYWNSGFGSFGNVLQERLVPTLDAARPFTGDGISEPLSKRFNFIADTFERAGPAVVFIDIKGRHPLTGQTTTISNGSGFIVRKDGLILTNAHVVANKQNVVVKLSDGREFAGHVQAVDQISDLATVKIECDNLPVLQMSDSSSLRPGEWVLAMGSPLNLSNSVTAGIVSAVHRGSRELGIRNKDIGYIQTDAVITFGNSGGPLVNLDGEVVGINTMKVTTGISFAIPSNYAKDFLKKAEEYQKRVVAKKAGGLFSSKPSTQDVSPIRRYMGITMLTLTPPIAMELQQRLIDFPDVQEGVFVHKVVVGSPAYTAGIRPGDVIVDINGSTVKSANDVYSATESNDRLTITVLRAHQRLLLSVTPENVV